MPGKDAFYKSSIKLLVNKFFNELNDKQSDTAKLKECFEYKFQVWAKKYISGHKIKDDVFAEVLKEIKNGGHKNDNRGDGC